MFTSGNNSNGQLGNGGAGALSAQFDPVDTTELPGGTTFGAISAGHFHSLAATIDGIAYAWGSNVQGQLGAGRSGTARNATPRHATPQAVKQPADTPITVVAAGKSHSIAV